MKKEPKRDFYEVPNIFEFWDNYAWYCARMKSLGLTPARPKQFFNDIFPKPKHLWVYFSQHSH